MNNKFYIAQVSINGIDAQIIYMINIPEELTLSIDFMDSLAHEMLTELTLGSQVLSIVQDDVGSYSAKLANGSIATIDWVCELPSKVWSSIADHLDEYIDLDVNRRSQTSLTLM